MVSKQSQTGKGVNIQRSERFSKALIFGSAQPGQLSLEKGARSLEVEGPAALGKTLPFQARPEAGRHSSDSECHRIGLLGSLTWL